MVTVAHLDTGYDPRIPPARGNVWTDRQRNFAGRALGTAPSTDSGGRAARNRGHGTGTIGILAGGDRRRRRAAARSSRRRARRAGAADSHRQSVVRFLPATMVQGFGYALECGVDVLSMSMGGLASSALADAVNRCYENGIVLVTAAGNFLHLVPSPRSIVYPARMRRVLAATGVMADGRAYFGSKMPAMQGCHGPDSKMDTAHCRLDAEHSLG